MSEERVIVLVDMDCFYVQVEKKLHPELVGIPCAIVQYNKWRGGGIIAVDYEARKYGVTRSLRGDDAKEKCPHIHLARVPEKRGKADLSNYRKASGEVMKVLSQFTSILERASIDEAYLDLTEPVKVHMNRMTSGDIQPETLPSTHVAGYESQLAVGADTADDDDDIAAVETESEEEMDSVLLSTDQADYCNIEDVQECDDVTQEVTAPAVISNQSVSNSTDKQFHASTKEWLKVYGNSDERMLSVGAILTQQIREAIFNQLGFTCSAGISYNKMLAKLAAGMNKPNQQTILPRSQLACVFLRTPFKKVRHLGGKLGVQVQETLGISYVGQLEQYSLKFLQDKFGAKTGLWLHEICRGKCHDRVRNRTITKSIGCGKNFTGPDKLTTFQKVHYWLEQLSGELMERLEEDIEENSRRAQSVTVHFLLEGSSSSLARTFQLPASYDVSYIVSSSWNAINKGHKPVKEADSPLTWTTGILNIHLSAGKFVQSSKGQMKLMMKSPAVTSSSDCHLVNSSSATTSAMTSTDPVILEDCQIESMDSQGPVSPEKFSTAAVPSLANVTTPSSSGRQRKITRQNIATKRKSKALHHSSGNNCKAEITKFFSPVSRNLTGTDPVVTSPCKVQTEESVVMTADGSSQKLLEDNHNKRGIGAFFTPIRGGAAKAKKLNVAEKVMTDHKTGIADFFTPIKRKLTGSDELIDTSSNRKQTGSDGPDTSSNKRHKESDDEQFSDNKLECTVCSICGEEILNLVLQEHMDYHLAMTLQTTS